MNAVSTDITSAPIYRIITDLNDLLTENRLDEAVRDFHECYEAADAFTANCMYDWLESSSRNAVDAGKEGMDLVGVYRGMFAGTFGSAADFDDVFGVEDSERLARITVAVSRWQYDAVRTIAKQEGLHQQDVLGLAVLGHRFDTRAFRKGIRQPRTKSLAVALPASVLRDLEETAEGKGMKRSAYIRDPKTGRQPLAKERITVTTATKNESLTAGLTAPLLMTDKEWENLTRSLHTDALVRMTYAGDWMSVDPFSGQVILNEVCPERTQWHTRLTANMMLRLKGMSVDAYIQESIAKFQKQFAPDLTGEDTVNNLALTYGLYSDEKHLMGIRWRGILTKDFGIVARGMEHSIL